jgi:hypothetical protein
LLGDAKSSLGDAKSSLGDAKSSLGDATSSLGDAESSLGDAKSSLVMFTEGGYGRAGFTIGKMPEFIADPYLNRCVRGCACVCDVHAPTAAGCSAPSRHMPPSGRFAMSAELHEA